MDANLTVSHNAPQSFGQHPNKTVWSSRLNSSKWPLHILLILVHAFLFFAYCLSCTFSDVVLKVLIVHGFSLWNSERVIQISAGICQVILFTFIVSLRPPYMSRDCVRLCMNLLLTLRLYFLSILINACMYVVTGCHSGILRCYRGPVRSRYVYSYRSVCLYILEVSKIRMHLFAVAVIEWSLVIYALPAEDLHCPSLWPYWKIWSLHVRKKMSNF